MLLPIRKRLRGRPKKPVEPPSPSATIEVWDERPALSSRPKMVGIHRHVPGDWTTEQIIRRYGIGSHLTIYRSAHGEPRHVVRHGH